MSNQPCNCSPQDLLCPEVIRNKIKYYYTEGFTLGQAETLVIDEIQEAWKQGKI